MARRLEPAARAAVDLAAVGPGDRVLDVATGTGNAALVAADRGGRVVGVDFEPALLRVAERRARQAGHDVRWVTGDISALPAPDESADAVLSVFGVMYSSDHVAAARELSRVAAPHARVALASWAPGSVLPAMGEVVGAYLPPPPVTPAPPSRWGGPDALMALLEAGGLHLNTASKRRLTLQFPDVRAAADFLIRTAGHVIGERERLIREGRWGDLHKDLSAFVQERADHADDHLDLALEYLLALASKSEREM